MAINQASVTQKYIPGMTMVNVLGNGSAPTPDATPMSSDELLMLFAQASGSNATVEQGIKDQITAAIGGKKVISDVETQLSGLAFNQDDNKNADASSVKDALTTAIQNCPDPQTKANLTAAYNKYFNDPGNGDTADNKLSTDEAKGLRDTLDNATSGIDDNMQMATLNLKTSQDKFSQITNLIKDILDSNNKIFTTINQNNA